MTDNASSERARQDVSVAVRNGIRLGGSLLATWSVALAVRFQLPRHLGPELFGQFNFCDALVGSVFSFLSFGVGTYIMREVAVRPAHANDFFGGLVAARSTLGILAMFGIAAVLRATGRPAELIELIYVFASANLIGGINSYLSNVLQAATQINALTNVNVIAKLLWGGGLMLAIAFDAPLYAIALPNLLSELLKLAVLTRAARTAIDLRMRIDVAATRAVLVASLPFYAHGIALDLGARVDVTMLELMIPGPEVGWYSAANSFASLALLISPVVGWVVMPLLSRAYARSSEEFYAILRASIRTVLLLAIPGSLTIALGADLWVTIAFGKSFAPAAGAVRFLAPMFLATYLAILLSVALVILQRSWSLTVVSIVSLVMEVVLVPPAVWALRDSGDGGAASGVAIGLVVAESLTAALMLRAVGRQALDRATVIALGKCLLLGAGTFFLDSALHSLGPARLAIDLAAYAVGVVATRAVRIDEARALVQLIRQRRG
jgi:O-antigen/teichoic acid export membrane protein